MMRALELRISWMAAAAGLALVGSTVYVAARAASVGFTYDEAYTYFRFVGAPLSTLVSFGGNADANNHTLNSLLMTLTSRAFGNSELALRLPNVLAFVGYGAAVLALMRRLRHSTSKVLGSVLLLLNPFLLEIFSLARGYGLALGFVVGSIAALAAAVDPGSGDVLARRRLAQAIALAAGAVFSNLACLNYFLPFAAVVVALGLRLWRREKAGGESPGRRRAALVRALANPAVWTGVVGLFAHTAITRLRAIEGLYYGGQTGFWSDTVVSLIRCGLYAEPYSAALTPVVAVLVGIVLARGAVLVLRRSTGEPPGTLPLLRALAFLLVMGSAASVVEHAIFGTPYLINRTAAWMLPCFLLVLVLEVEIGLGSGARFLRLSSAAGGWVLIAAGLAHGVSSANTRYAILQYHDADTKEMLRDLQHVGSRSAGTGRGLILLASWELAPSLEYYRVTRPLKWLEAVTSAPGPADAAFLSPKDAGLMGSRVIWKRYPITQNILALAPEALPATPAPGTDAK